MRRLIYTYNANIRDSIASLLSLEKKPDAPSTMSLYQKGEWILLYSEENIFSTTLPLLLESYDPDRVYLPLLGRSVDMIHEIGDIILPNVFFTYNPAIEGSEINEENRDDFLLGARFLELYDEQKDYYVEDYGLSVGGIIVTEVPDQAELNEKLMMAYEADAYVADPIGGYIDATASEEVPVLLSVGIVEGKVPKNLNSAPIDQALRNMLTTWRLMDSEDQE